MSVHTGRHCCDQLANVVPGYRGHGDSSTSSDTSTTNYSISTSTRGSIDTTMSRSPGWEDGDVSTSSECLLSQHRYIHSSSAVPVWRSPEARSPAGPRPRCRRPSCCRMCRSTAVARVTQGRDTAAYLQQAVAALQPGRQLHRHVVETLQLAHNLKLLAVLQTTPPYSS